MPPTGSAQRLARPAEVVAIVGDVRRWGGCPTVIQSSTHVYLQRLEERSIVFGSQQCTWYEHQQC